MKKYLLIIILLGVLVFSYFVCKQVFNTTNNSSSASSVCTSSTSC